MDGICEIATSAPGYTSVLPKSKPASDDLEVERLLDGAIRQVPGGAGMGLPISRSITEAHGAGSGRRRTRIEVRHFISPSRQWMAKHRLLI
jgi:hypothetical protein